MRRIVPRGTRLTTRPNAGFGRDAAKFAALAAALAAVGCGGGKEIAVAVSLPQQAHYDRFFFQEPEADDVAAEKRDAMLRAEIERLMLPTWEIARKALLAAGKEAIPRLVENLDRKEPTHVAIRPVPARTVPDMSATWNLGQVAYSILLDMVGGRSDYAGSGLPPLDKAAWQKWWVDNSKQIRVHTSLTTVPEYVRKQQEEARIALAARYDRRGRLIEEATRSSYEDYLAKVAERKKNVKGAHKGEDAEGKKAKGRDAEVKKAKGKGARKKDEAPAPRKAKEAKEAKVKPGKPAGKKPKADAAAAKRKKQEEAERKKAQAEAARRKKREDTERKKREAKKKAPAVTGTEEAAAPGTGEPPAEGGGGAPDSGAATPGATDEEAPPVE